MTEQKRAIAAREADLGSVYASQILDRRLPVPPFTRETAILQVRLAEDGWNSRNPERVALA